MAPPLERAMELAVRPMPGVIFAAALFNPGKQATSVLMPEGSGLSSRA
jgi:predicted hydrolase (HD superfamily)